MFRLLFFMAFSVVWSVAWFFVKLYLVEVARPDGKVVNNAGRLRHLLAQYQVEFVMDRIAYTVKRLEQCEEIPPAERFTYEAEKNASIYRDRLLYIASNLAGDNDADLGIPEVNAESAKPALRHVSNHLLVFDEVWKFEKQQGRADDVDPYFASRVLELHDLLEFVNDEIVNVAADTATDHTQMLHVAYLVSGIVGTINAIFVAFLLFREVMNRYMRAVSNRHMLELCVDHTCYLNDRWQVEDSADFNRTFGTRSIVNACLTREAKEQMKTFLATLWASGPPSKITTTFRGIEDDTMYDCNVCGVNDGGDRLLIGLKILDTRTIAPLPVSLRNGSVSESHFGKEESEAPVRSGGQQGPRITFTPAIHSDDRSPQTLEDADQVRALNSSLSRLLDSKLSTCDTPSTSVVNMGHNDWRELEINHHDLVLQDKQVVGAGGSGQIFRANFMHCDVAVKVLYDSQMRTPGVVKQMRREVGALSRLRHPHILLLLGAVTKPNPLGVCIVTQLCWGGSVRDRLFVSRDMTLRPASTISSQVLSALVYMHSYEIAHRDLKTCNVFLLTHSLEEPFALLGDFGMSRDLIDDTGQQTPGIMLGTAGYMAPELFLDDGEYSFPADVFAYGVFLFEILTGRTIFTMEEIRSMYSQMDPTAPPPGDKIEAAVVKRVLFWAGREGRLPDRLEASLPKGIPGLVTMLRRCLHKDPMERPASSHLCLLMDDIFEGKRWSFSPVGARPRDVTNCLTNVTTASNGCNNFSTNCSVDDSSDDKITL